MRPLKNGGRGYVGGSVCRTWGILPLGESCHLPSQGKVVLLFFAAAMGRS